MTITRKASIISGISLIIMTIAAMYSFGFVHTEIFVDSVSQTIKNIQSSPIFLTGIIGWLVVIVTDILVTWGFYKVLLTYDKKLALMSLLTRGVYTVFLMVAVYNLFSIQVNINTILENNLLQKLNNFDTIWSLGLIVFGIHLLVVGLAVLKNSQKILGPLLIIAGLSYVLISVLENFFPTFAYTTTINNILMLPMIVGELGFGIWLLVKGGNQSTNFK